MSLEVWTGDLEGRRSNLCCWIDCMLLMLLLLDVTVGQRGHSCPSPAVSSCSITGRPERDWAKKHPDTLLSSTTERDRSSQEGLNQRHHVVNSTGYIYYLTWDSHLRKRNINCSDGRKLRLLTNYILYNYTSSSPPSTSGVATVDHQPPSLPILRLYRHVLPGISISNILCLMFTISPQTISTLPHLNCNCSSQ